VSDPLRIVVWPGMPDRAGLDRAAEAIGRRLEIAVISANEDLERLLEREGPWDLITPSDYLVEKLATAGRLAELDPRGELDRDQLAGWSRRPGYDPEERWSWPLAFGTTGLLYDRAAVESPSWVAFFAPADGVAVGLLAEVREVVGAALIARGHSPNAADPAALAAARELLDRQRPAVRSVSSDDFTGPVERREVAMHHAWSGPAAIAARRDPGLGYAVPAEGALLWVTTAAIPADAPDPEGPRRLLAALIRPEIARLAVENGGYSTPNDRVRAVLPEELRADPALFPPEDVIARCERLTQLDGPAEARLLAAWP